MDLQENRVTQTLKEKLGLKQLIGGASTFLTEIKKIPLIARCDANVLISGETGTGKELCARAIHYVSPRSSKPFIPINCGAIPVELLENELFGHKRGAFTGAYLSEFGIIQEANGGTLFLDEIDCLPLLAQVKLLRFIQDKEYKPLGSKKLCKVDARIISATNIDLQESVKKGRFRQDLFYRLSVFPLTLPPLRERREDIPLLAQHFLAKYSAEYNKRVTKISSDVTQILILYDWPGNIRELEHVIERAVLLSEGVTIIDSDIYLPNSETTPSESFKEVKTKVITQFERKYIQKLLLVNNGNISKAAAMARKNRRAFWQLLKKYRIDAKSFRRVPPFVEEYR